MEPFTVDLNGRLFLSAEEMDGLTRDAEAAGKTVEELVRERVLKAAGSTRGEIAVALAPASQTPWVGNLRFSNLGGLVDALLKKAGMTYKDAEAKIGGDVSSWSLWVNNKRAVSDDTLAKLASAAGMNPDEVVGHAILKAYQSANPSDEADEEKIAALLGNVLKLVK